MLKTLLITAVVLTAVVFVVIKTNDYYQRKTFCKKYLEDCKTSEKMIKSYVNVHQAALTSEELKEIEMLLDIITDLRVLVLSYDVSPKSLTAEEILEMPKLASVIINNKLFSKIAEENI